MGTNFYYMRWSWFSLRYVEQHVGKRSAAGEYCWTCKCTLCKTGIDGVHSGRAEWYSSCPGCGQSRSERKETSTGFVELGMLAPDRLERVGVTSCCSFTWAVHKDHFMGKRPNDIVDEYGRHYTFEEFVRDVMNISPIEFFHNIGEEFS